MAELRNNRFIKYFPMVLDALRSTDPAAMKPPEVVAWIRARTDVSAGDLTRVVENGRQTIFENDVHWARFYLVKAGLLEKGERGIWSLTSEGRAARLDDKTTWDLYVQVRDSNRTSSSKNEQDELAPELVAAETEAERSYWFVGAAWEARTADQTSRFLSEGVWQNGYEDQFLDQVREMKPGDRIAIKASFVRRQGLPFELNGKAVSVMRIKATGMILENSNDGRTVKVAWDPNPTPRDWYFFTYRSTVIKADMESEKAQFLVKFTFYGEPLTCPRPRYHAIV